MQQVKTILLSKSVFEDNDAEAERLRSELREKNICLVNVMSSPGSGKTTLLVALINSLKQSFDIGVMEADIDSDKDDFDHNIRLNDSLTHHTRAAEMMQLPYKPSFGLAFTFLF